jgi:hypothetical protein
MFYLLGNVCFVGRIIKAVATPAVFIDGKEIGNKLVSIPKAMKDPST